MRGFDASFSAPKSLSVVVAIGDQQLRREVTEAHDRAVDAVLGWVTGGGKLRAGLEADLVVLGRNLFEIPPHEIAATPVMLTMRAGEVTHET